MKNLIETKLEIKYARHLKVTVNIKLKINK